MSDSAAVNDVYETDTSDSFDDIGDDSFVEPDMEVNGEDEDEEDSDPTPLYKRATTKENGSNGDDLKILDTIEEDEEDSEEEKPATEPKDKVKEVEKDEAAKEEPKQESKLKGQKTYIKVGEETFAIDSHATVSHKVDGKVENISIQELKNNYAGKVAWDKRMNEVNVSKQTTDRREAAIVARESKVSENVNDIMTIINDIDKNPFEALYKIVDMNGGDRYAFWERTYKAQLEEFSDFMSKGPLERSNFFLEKKNEYLSQQHEKRTSSDAQTQKANNYRVQADALRKSYDVNETQYVDAYEEIKSWGYEPAEITEQQIVEWAAIKPHKAAVEPVLERYRDQISEESYGELCFKLSGYLRTGDETLESITAHLEDVFGASTEIKEFNQQLSPVGRRKTSQSAPIQNSKKIDSFDDFEDN